MITVAASPSLTAAARQAQTAAAALASDVAAVNRAATAWVRAAVTAHAATHLDRAIAATTHVTAAGPSLTVTVGDGRRLSGGAVTRDLAGGVEFGADRDKRVTYSTRRGRVTRRTRRQLPPYTRRGRLAYAALPDIAPRLLGQLVDTVTTDLEA